MNFLNKESKFIKNFFFFFVVFFRGGMGVEGGSRESDFFTKNPNLKKDIFEGVGEGGLL